MHLSDPNKKVVESPVSKPKEPIKVDLLTSYYEQTKGWHDDFKLAFGFQKIRVKLGDDTEKRTVFFVEKR
jgi:hypothetical protein